MCEIESLYRIKNKNERKIEQYLKNTNLTRSNRHGMVTIS